MINTIIFDFGNIFINLNDHAVENAFSSLGLQEWNNELKELNFAFETGKISEKHFLEGIKNHLPGDINTAQVKEAWNTILGDFPLYRLEFLQLLSQKYRLFLLSNTDAIHVDTFEHKVGVSFFSDFYQCFEKVYFSHELGLRKPEAAIFNYVIKTHDLSPKRTLFVDDRKENTDTAASFGLHTWHLKVGQEDVVDLFSKKIIATV